MLAHAQDSAPTKASEFNQQILNLSMASRQLCIFGKGWKARSYLCGVLVVMDAVLREGWGNCVVVVGLVGSRSEAVFVYEAALSLLAKLGRVRQGHGTIYGCV